MGSIVLFQGRVYLIDAGPNIDHALTALGIGVNEIDGIFHTHSTENCSPLTVYVFQLEVSGAVEV
jgi:hemerythrin